MFFQVVFFTKFDSLYNYVWFLTLYLLPIPLVLPVDFHAESCFLTVQLMKVKNCTASILGAGPLLSCFRWIMHRKSVVQVVYCGGGIVLLYLKKFMLGFCTVVFIGMNTLQEIWCPLMRSTHEINSHKINSLWDQLGIIYYSKCVDQNTDFN